MDEKAQERFWRKINLVGPNDCWEWTAGKISDGYGSFRIKDKTIYTHRLMWELLHGPIPSGKLILHKCDNPLCCNPDHLFIGTQTDNMQDMYRKGRANPMRGEKHGMTKLTEHQVREIRKRYAAGGTSHSKLAKEYKMSKVQIGRIIRRQRWIWLK